MLLQDATLNQIFRVVGKNETIYLAFTKDNILLGNKIKIHFQSYGSPEYVVTIDQIY